MNTYGNLYFTRVLSFKENSKYTSAIYSYFKGIIAIESNFLTTRVWTLQAAQSVKEWSMVVKY